MESFEWSLVKDEGGTREKPATEAGHRGPLTNPWRSVPRRRVLVPCDRRTLRIAARNTLPNTQPINMAAFTKFFAPKAPEVILYTNSPY